MCEHVIVSDIFFVHLLWILRMSLTMTFYNTSFFACQ
nr:MAG TPA: hypothetical protein [Caudoviricetes sp.]